MKRVERRGASYVMAALVMAAIFLVFTALLAVYFSRQNQLTTAAFEGNREVLAKAQEKVQAELLSVNASTGKLTYAVRNVGAVATTVTRVIYVEKAGGPLKTIPFTGPPLLMPGDAWTFEAKLMNCRSAKVMTERGNSFDVPLPCKVTFTLKCEVDYGGVGGFGEEVQRADVLVVDGKAYMVRDLPLTFYWVPYSEHYYEWRDISADVSETVPGADRLYAWNMTVSEFTGIELSRSGVLKPFSREGTVEGRYKVYHKLHLTCSPQYAGSLTALRAGRDGWCEWPGTPAPQAYVYVEANCEPGFDVGFWRVDGGEQLSGADHPFLEVFMSEPHWVHAVFYCGVQVEVLDYEGYPISGVPVAVSESPMTVEVYPSELIWIRRSYPDATLDGKLGWVLVGQEPEGGGVRTLVSFDISGIPPGASIVSARLMFYYSEYWPENPAGRTIDCHMILQSWSNTTTWNTQPVYNPAASDGVTVPAAPGTWLEWDVTGDVAFFIKGSRTNYGWILKMRREDLYATFAYFSTSVPEHYMRLTVTYTLGVHSERKTDGNGVAAIYLPPGRYSLTVPVKAECFGFKVGFLKWADGLNSLERVFVSNRPANFTAVYRSALIIQDPHAWFLGPNLELGLEANYWASGVAVSVHGARVNDAYAYATFHIWNLIDWFTREADDATHCDPQRGNGYFCCHATGVDLPVSMWAELVVSKSGYEDAFWRSDVQTFDFALSVNPSSLTVARGGTGTVTVTVSLASPPSQEVRLIAFERAANPVGMNFTFTVESGFPTFQSVLTVTVPSDAPTGTYTVVVCGTYGDLVRQCEVKVTVVE